MSTSSLPTLNDPVEFIDPPPTGITVTAETQALPAQQAIPDVAGALPALQAIPQQAAVPMPPPPLRRSERQRIPRVHLVDQDANDDGELDILRNIQNTVAKLPEDDDGVETALMTQLTLYLAENPINIEYPDDPRNYRKAMAAPDAPAWIDGTREELKALKDLSVYELVAPTSVPYGKTILDLKAVYMRKRNEHSEVVQNKVRYCVLGCRQKYSHDYEQTTSPTARLESFCTVLHVAVSRGWDVQQIDAKTAFLNATLPPDEIQYSRQPKHFEEPGKEGWIWKIVKALYGLKQAGRAWNRALHEAMLEWGFRRLPCEWCVYVWVANGTTNLVAIHVDDMVAAASNVSANDLFKSQLRSKWAISDLGEIKFCLGINVVRDPERRTISLSQTALIDRLVSQFFQTNADSPRTPMEHRIDLQRPTSDAPPLSHEDSERLAATPYRSLVMSMMYLALGTRPDIAFAISKLSGFLDCYGTAHWQAAIHVLRYLKGTQSMSLTLGGTQPIALVGHGDADYANDTGRKSIMGYTFSLGSGAILWASRKQKVVALSLTESEYIAASEGAKDACWLRMLLRGLTVPVESATTLFCDNNSAIVLANNQSLHICAKHIDIRYHHIRDCVDKDKIRLLRVPTDDNTADTLTKALPHPAFIRHRSGLGIA
jgi:hypothetical protein